MTRPGILLEEIGYYKYVCREYTKPRDEVRCRVERCYTRNTRIRQIHHLLVTRQNGRCGIDVLIDSLANDGSRSWAVIRRGVGSHVTERSTECTQWMHADTSSGVTAVWSTGRPEADGTRRPLKRTTSQQLGMTDACW